MRAYIAERSLAHQCDFAVACVVVIFFHFFFFEAYRVCLLNLKWDENFIQGKHSCPSHRHQRQIGMDCCFLQWLAQQHESRALVRMRSRYKPQYCCVLYLINAKNKTRGSDINSLSRPDISIRIPLYSSQSSICEHPQKLGWICRLQPYIWWIFVKPITPPKHYKRYKKWL